MTATAFDKWGNVIFENSHDYIESAIASAQRMHYDYSVTMLDSYSHSVAQWPDGDIAWDSRE